MALPSKAELQQELKDLLTETEQIKGNTFGLLNRHVAILNQMETLFGINFEHIQDKDLENFEHFVKLFVGLEKDEQGNYWNDRMTRVSPLTAKWTHFFEKLRETIARVRTEKPAGYEMSYRQAKRAQAQAALEDNNKWLQNFQSHANPYVLMF